MRKLTSRIWVFLAFRPRQKQHPVWDKNPKAPVMTLLSPLFQQVVTPLLEFFYFLFFTFFEIGSPLSSLLLLRKRKINL